jgi:hypothetical protein
MAKYEKLTEWLKNPTVVLTFAEIEKIIGDKLPDAAANYRPWWGNEKDAKSRQCRAWLDAGWEVGKVDLNAKLVLFRRTQP